MTIVLEESNGASASASVTYAKSKDGLELVSRKQAVTQPDGACFIEDYGVAHIPGVVGDYLKLRSRKSVD